jgi:predicted 3-demethylubiquinone-9 3-methyltransferase (glyoxalase superfamily)
VTITHYGKAGFETHHRPAGSVLTVVVELDGQEFTALNGGPAFKFNESISFEVKCRTQDDIPQQRSARWSRCSQCSNSTSPS